jgi:hypothetical protein
MGVPAAEGQCSARPVATVRPGAAPYDVSSPARIRSAISFDSSR